MKKEIVPANQTEWRCDSLFLDDLNEWSNLNNRALVFSRKPSRQGRIKIQIGRRYSRCV